MSKEKQITEMAKVIDKCPWKLEQDFTGCNINSSDIAEFLYNAGYRKQSEIAREAIDVLCELHDHFKSVGDIREAFAMLFAIAELKKKYTEEQK